MVRGCKGGDVNTEAQDPPSGVFSDVPPSPLKPRDVVFVILHVKASTKPLLMHYSTISCRTTGRIPEKNTVEMEEASKMMAGGILAYVKAVVSHTTQSTTQGNLQHRGMVQGMGSSRTGETRRSIPTPPNLEESDAWKVAQHKNFPKPLTRTHKRKMLRERAVAKTKTVENTVSKSKFYIKATEDKSSEDGDDILSEEDAQENKTIDFRVGEFHISVDCNTGMVISP
ncbi:hypothetical protein F511_14178 [Dorcoceras hygrometricum]|uniref:Uncharacterized protein n=1 Tax=Dorcoceras hygrometricum TaxID=472368 RepID=A0A2Z7BYP0_9LAMI|nr:hypothetical protein F511_14178 [Dorcoceras hygrometricum]